MIEALGDGVKMGGSLLKDIRVIKAKGNSH